MSIRKKMKDSAVLIAIAGLSALSYEVFIFPNSFAPAGLIGVATMIQYKMDISAGYMNLLINLPLCLLAFFTLNRDFAKKTFLFSLSLSVFLIVFQYGFGRVPFLRYVTPNGTSTTLAPFAAGAINGLIYGMAIRCNGSTGGTDVIAAYVQKNKPEMSLVWIIFALDSMIAAVSFFVYDYKFEPVICCIIFCFLTSKFSDVIVRGGREAVKFEIITDDFDSISKEIIKRLRHSATVIPARGMYSGKETDFLICVINKHQVVELQTILSRYPGSFAYISSVSETLGNFSAEQ